jgi:hypothetical protein
LNVTCRHGERRSTFGDRIAAEDLRVVDAANGGGGELAEWPCTAMMRAPA